MPKRCKSVMMPKRNPKRVKVPPLKIRRASPADGGDDAECFVAIDVEAVSDREDENDEDGNEEDGNEEDETDKEVHKIDTSWIKKEPMFEEPSDDESLDEELYINTPEEQNGDDHAVKRKRDGDEEELELGQKHIKMELEDEYLAAGALEIIAQNVKMEENNLGNDSDDFWEEDENDVAQVGDFAPAEEQNTLLLLPFQANMQKCAKCAVMFKPSSFNLPSQLQNICHNCKPNVSITCKLCGKHFEHHKLYKRHARDCSQNLFACNICKERFPTERKLLHHRCQEEKTKDMMCFICPICCEGFDKSKQRNHHKSLHVTDKAIKCKHCRKLFTDFSTFHDHMDSHSGRIFICLLCHLTFETQAAYFEDQRKHKEDNPHRSIPQRPPDCVYLCKFCKHWYSDQDCPHICPQKRGLITRDITDVRKDAVPRLLVFGKNCEPASMQPPPPPPPKQVLQRTLGRTFTLKLTNKEGSPAQAELSNQIKIIAKPSHSSPQNILPSKQNAQPKGKLSVLDSSYTCQLCQVSFETTHDLGHHACLNHTSFANEDDGDEEDEEEEEEEEDLVQQTTRNNQPLRQPPVQRILDISYVMARPAPNQQTKPPGSNQDHSPASLLGASGKHRLTAHRCALCTTVVRHNFEPIRGKWSAKYLCPRCIQKGAKNKNWVFKCSKCGQNFPSWSRLHLHLPWHREKKVEEGVFKEPRLACKKSPPEEKSSNPPIPHHSSPKQGKTPATNTGRNDNAGSLSALLKEPVTLLKSVNSSPEDASQQGVKDLLKKKILEGNASIQTQIASNTSVTGQQVQGKLILNARPIALERVVPEEIADHGVSLMSKVHHGLFPPVVGNVSKQAYDEMANSGSSQNDCITSEEPCPSNCENSDEQSVASSSNNDNLPQTPVTSCTIQDGRMQMDVEIRTEGHKKTVHVVPKKQDVVQSTEPQNLLTISESIQEAGDMSSVSSARTPKRREQMDVEITTEGNRKTVHLLPKKQDVIQSIEPQNLLTISESIQVEGGMSSVCSASTPVPLTLNGNALTKMSPDGCVAIPTSMVSGSPARMPKLILPKLTLPDSSSVVLASSSPSISSAKLTESSNSNVTVQNSSPGAALTGNLTSGSSINMTLQNISPATVSTVKLSSNINVTTRNNIPVSSSPMQLIAVPGNQAKEQSPRGVFFCYTCNLLFMDIASLKAHGCPIQAYTCHLCNNLFPTPEQLYSHECSKHSYTCHSCNKTCSSAKDLIQHTCSNANNTNNKADKELDPMKQEIKQALKQRIQSRPLAVSKGGRDAPDVEKRLRSMTWNEISKVNNYTCPACSLKFNSKASLYIHKMKHNMRV